MNKLDLNARLHEVRKRAEAATKGPWSYYGSDNVIVSEAEEYSYAPEIAEEFTITSDAEFIAHARQDVPALIAEVERLNGVVGTLVSDLELIEDHTEGRGLLLVQEAIKYGEEELRG